MKVRFMMCLAMLLSMSSVSDAGIFKCKKSSTCAASSCESAPASCSSGCEDTPALAAQQLNPAVVAVPMLLRPVVVVAVGRLLLIRRWLRLDHYLC